MKRTLFSLLALVALGTAALLLAPPNALAQAKYFDAATNTATASTGAATLNTQTGTITSESLSTAAGGDYTLTLTNSLVKATSVVLATVAQGTNTTVEPAVTRITPGTGSVVIIVRNLGASALNGTIKITYVVLAP